MSSAVPRPQLNPVKPLRNLSLELKLPLLMSVVLATVLSIALLATYSTLRNTAMQSARERLVRATRQIATVGASGIGTLTTRYKAVGEENAVRLALAQWTPARAAAARRSLATLSQRSDSGMPVEVWSSTGRKIAFVGQDVPVTMREDLRAELPERIALALDPNARRPLDSLMVGPLYQDAGRMHFWLVMPVIERGQVLGYITHQRVVATGAQTQQTLRELSGDSVSFY